jgi:hypothetical protein
MLVTKLNKLEPILTESYDSYFCSQIFLILTISLLIGTSLKNDSVSKSPPFPIIFKAISINISCNSVKFILSFKIMVLKIISV